MGTHSKSVIWDTDLTFQAGHDSLGSSSSSNREGAKNSGGKKAGRSPAQVSTGRLMVLGGCTQLLVTSGKSAGH